MTTAAKPRPVFGETPAKSTKPPQICAWCTEAPATTRMEIRVKLIPLVRKRCDCPSELATACFVCGPCGRHKGIEIYEGYTPRRGGSTDA